MSGSPPPPDPRIEIRRQNLLKIGAIVVIGGLAGFALSGRYLRRDMSTVSKEATRLYHAAHHEEEYLKTARKAEEAARALRSATTQRVGAAGSTASTPGHGKAAAHELATGKATVAVSAAAEGLSRRLAEGTKPVEPPGGSAEGLPGVPRKAASGAAKPGPLYYDDDDEDDVVVAPKSSGSSKNMPSGAPSAAAGDEKKWKEWR